METAALLQFLDQSKNAYFAVNEIQERLTAHGFIRLFEGERWELSPGKYFVTRDGSSLLAFQIPKRDYRGFHIVASHSDSPTFKLKPNEALTAESVYQRLNTERYGGMIYYSWLDRPLSVAGRVLYSENEEIRTRLIDIDRDLLVIPSLAIHMEKKLNEGYPFDPQKDLLPLVSMNEKGTVRALLSKEAGIAEEDILDADLFLYPRQPAAIFGAENEFLGGARLDDLLCAYGALEGFLSAAPTESAAVYALFHNEEVGSETKQGAASSFLSDTLRRIHTAFARDEEDFLSCLPKSFLLSADNAHAVHPNQPDKADPTNRPKLNHGIVLKYNANQKYTTDAVSGAIVRTLCKKAGVPVQTFTNRSDMAGGSTLGSIAVARLSMNAADIGLPQLAMHSAFETAGTKDVFDLVSLCKALYSVSIESRGDGNYQITEYSRRH